MSSNLYHAQRLRAAAERQRQQFLKAVIVLATGLAGFIALLLAI